MHGAIAAGHPLTAEAGARALEAGGSAVDACLAAAFTSWVAESPLTGPGGGGFMLVHTARDQATRLLDFFVAVPGLGLRADEAPAPMEEVDVEFTGGGGGGHQVFRIGAPSCAVPGAVAGLEEAHRRFGTLPWADLVAPAAALACEGVELTAGQAYLHAILDSILNAHPEGRAIFAPDGHRLSTGDRLAMPDLADTLDVLARDGAAALYDGELGRRLVDHVRAGGGTITRDDLRAYRVVRRRPVTVAFDRHDFVSNPPPSSGGILIAYGLKLLDRLAPRAAGSAAAMAELVEILREQARARQAWRASDLYRGGLRDALLGEAATRAALARIARAPAVAEPPAARGTTHISVIDRAGNAASLTISTGSGSGVVVPGTGIQLNNMLGEFDLNVAGARPGVRLTSMMAPSIVLGPAGPRLVVGSAGSLRLRGAILQVVVNVVRHGMSVEEAIAAPRLHVDDEHVHLEGGADRAEADALEAAGYDLVRWRRRNLFFGGAAAVERRPDGELHAAGDPRRGGHGVVV
jgi:gamma-glutamyltranspeptidase / glutathione hydrolase